MSAARGSAPATRRDARATVVAAIVTVMAALVVAGCGMFNKDKTEPEELSAEEHYLAAKQALAKESWASAIERYGILEATYPYGQYAEQAQLEMAYAYYKNDDPVSALATIDRFIQLHPTHEHLDYAYYLKGLIYYPNEDPGLVDKLFTANDPTTSDPGSVEDAFEAFRALVSRFPNSRYAADARERMATLLDIMARHDINVASFYMRRGAYVAVVNRAKYVIEHYQETQSVEDALALMAEAYMKMGLSELAVDALRVLELNFPQSAHLARLREEQKEG